jgi:MGT family glycosyltransferase
MAHILVATVPVIGHVNPFFPLVRALIGRGHEVRWYTGNKFRAHVEAAGARHLPFEQARDYDDAQFEAAFPRRAELRGVDKLKFDIKHVFIDNAPGQVRDLEEIAREYPADLIVADPGMIGASWLRERAGVSVALLNVLPMGLSSRDVPPTGMGLAPSASILGRLRNRTLHWALEHALFRDVQQHWNATRAGIGLPPTGWFQDTALDVELYMQPSVPGFEFPRSDLAPNVHFIGAMPAEAPRAWQAPGWWGDLDGARPVVHVTQGTVANKEFNLVRAVLDGLADEDVLVVASTGGRPVEALGALPANARAASFLSYPELLPRATAMVTNGGYGGVQQALGHGVPLVVAGTTEDKPEVAARVAYSGAGINLRTDAPSAEQLRHAVRSLLRDERYRRAARSLRDEYARYDAVSNGVALIERLAATRRPVLRGAVEVGPSGEPAIPTPRLD